MCVIYCHLSNHIKLAYSPISLTGVSLVNLVSIFRCSSSVTNRGDPRRVDSSTLDFSLSLDLVLSIHNKQQPVPLTRLVVTSALTSADVSLTSGTRSPDETDGAAGSVTHSIFVRFTSNFVHLHSLPPLQERVMSRLSLINIFSPKIPT